MYRFTSSLPVADILPRIDGHCAAFPVEETESRLDFRSGKSMLVPYRKVALKDDNGNIPLHEVVVGPNPNKEQSRRSVQSLLNNQKSLKTVKARNSDIPYRNW
jgi:hypothetical protein